jgi:hypothetical protein
MTIIDPADVDLPPTQPIDMTEILAMAMANAADREDESG